MGCLSFEEAANKKPDLVLVNFHWFLFLLDFYLILRLFGIVVSNIELVLLAVEVPLETPVAVLVERSNFIERNIKVHLSSHF